MKNRILLVVLLILCGSTNVAIASSVDGYIQDDQPSDTLTERSRGNNPEQDENRLLETIENTIKKSAYKKAILREQEGVSLGRGRNPTLRVPKTSNS